MQTTDVLALLTLPLQLYLVCAIIPSITVEIRRLHDTNRSGWRLLLGFIPYIGGLILLILCCLPPTPARTNTAISRKRGGVNFARS